MGHVTIQLSTAQEAMIQERIAAGEFASLDEYVAALIDAETKARAQERLEESLLEGLQGPDSEWTDADSERLMRLAVTGR